MSRPDLMAVLFDQWLACDLCEQVSRRADLNTEDVVARRTETLKCRDEGACRQRVSTSSNHTRRRTPRIRGGG